MWQSWWGGPLVRAGPPGPALRSRNQDPGIGDRPARGPAADRAGVRISARRDLAAELPVRRSVLDGNRQILGDQPGAISHKAVSGQCPSRRRSDRSTSESRWLRGVACLVGIARLEEGDIRLSAERYNRPLKKRPFSNPSMNGLARFCESWMMMKTRVY
jgi:hypothetical protein